MITPLSPPIGPHIIKACVEQVGLSSEVFDLNIELFEFLKSKAAHNVFYEEDLFYPDQKGRNTQTVLDFFKKYELNDLFKNYVVNILDRQPRAIGISLFSNRSAYFNYFLLSEIAKLKSKIPIVLGGPFALHLLKNPDIRKKFPFEFDLVVGEAEKSIVQYLQGNFNYPGINSEPERTNIEDSPKPSYRTSDFEKYDKISGDKISLITGSRGCVRRCTFCDVKVHWPKYSYKSTQKVYDEMIDLIENHGRTSIHFTDSLINGNMVILRELCQMLATYREQKNNHFVWYGHFICRSSISMKPEDYDILKKAGCASVSIGIESGSEKVRSHMKKMFSDEDLFYTLEQLKRVKIDVMALMLVGYLNEGPQEFQESLRFYEKCIHKKIIIPNDLGQSTIKKINLGMTLNLTPGTEAHQQYMSQASLVEDDSDFKWGNEWELPGNNRYIRLQRLFLTMIHLKKIGAEEQAYGSIANIYKKLFVEFKKIVDANKIKNCIDAEIILEIGKMEARFVSDKKNNLPRHQFKKNYLSKYIGHLKQKILDL